MVTSNSVEYGADILDTLHVPASVCAVTSAEVALAERKRTSQDASISDNTRRAYMSAVSHYLTWGGMLPADEPAMIRYLMDFAELLNPRTLALRLTALSRWHTYHGFADPASSPTVRKNLAVIARMYGRPKRKAKALPIEDLELIVARLASLATLKAARDSALLQVGFFGGFRRSELVGISVIDVLWEREGIEIMMPCSKNDQAGERIVKAIPYSNGPCCPAKALRDWLSAAGIVEGPVFRSVSKWDAVSVSALSVASINTILKYCATITQLNYVPNLSSHSLRSGMFTSALRVGAEFRDTNRQGDWRDDGTAKSYKDEARRFEKDAAVSLLQSRTKGR